MDRFQSRLLLWGILGAAALGGSAVAQLPTPLAVSERTPADYLSLRELPLFAPDRRAPKKFEPVEIPAPVVVEPPAEIEIAAEPEVEFTPPEWELVGVVRSTRLVIATFRAEGAEGAFSLRQGESRDGWTLADVRGSEVVLDGEGGQALIRFRSLQ
ncbi:hypothetical protein [Aquibium oceanicum]|uniref:Uncharacterized protein n=1 Tax=Aquibium oceanicum TaxID=1670800 RepID=A0A1L3SVV0_9HYPH|nr:hypothetical protein [Aquibium oceanicum]APH73474.1 hypothetical protein BSQ44_20445 [Aquibium oceanicum]